MIRKIISTLIIFVWFSMWYISLFYYNTIHWNKCLMYIALGAIPTAIALFVLIDNVIHCKKKHRSSEKAKRCD